jgi:hypothetical protein
MTATRPAGLIAMHLMTDTAGSAFPAPSSKLLVTPVTVVTSLLSG